MELWSYRPESGNGSTNRVNLSGDEPRAYGDSRDSADVVGGRKALKPPVAKRAATDSEIA